MSGIFSVLNFKFKMLIIKNSNKEFQIKIGRENFVEIQAVRQSMLKQFFKVKNNKAYAILLFFEKSDKLNLSCRKEFEKSKYKKISKIITINKRKVDVILINDFDSLKEELSFIQSSIFKYKKDEQYEYTIEFN